MDYIIKTQNVAKIIDLTDFSLLAYHRMDLTIDSLYIARTLREIYLYVFLYIFLFFKAKIIQQILYSKEWKTEVNFIMI